MNKIVDRRSLLSATAAGAVACTASPAAATERDVSLETLNEIIACLEAARRADLELYEAADAILGLPDVWANAVRVEVGQRLVGHDDDGNLIREPMLAYSDEAIAAHYESQASTLLVAVGQTAAAHCAETAAMKKAELAALEAARTEALERHEYTGLKARADSAYEKRKAAEDAFLDFVPTSTAAMSRKAGFMAQFAEGQPDGFLHEEQILQGLRAMVGGCHSAAA